MSDTPMAPFDPAAHERIDFRARIPKYLLDEARELAEEDDRSLNGLLTHALAAYLAQRQADRARLDRPDEYDVVEVTGPWGGDGDHRLVVDGVEVPFVRVSKREAPGTSVEADGAKYVLTLDNQYQTAELTWGELWTQAWFWANAMAIAAGWTCHGQNARRIARHGGEWAEHGWAIMDESGSSGHGYGVDVRFTLPAMEGCDQKAYEVKRAVMRAVTEHGGRDPWASLVSYAGVEIDHAEMPAPLTGALTDSSARPGPPGATLAT